MSNCTLIRSKPKVNFVIVLNIFENTLMELLLECVLFLTWARKTCITYGAQLGPLIYLLKLPFHDFYFYKTTSKLLVGTNFSFRYDFYIFGTSSTFWHDFNFLSRLLVFGTTSTFLARLQLFGTTFNISWLIL